MLKFLRQLTKLVMSASKNDALVSFRQCTKRPLNEGDSTSSELSASHSDEPFKKKNKKRVRYAMLLAYQGKNYFGMQFQKDARTIEGCLLEAMQKSDLITEEQKKQPYLFFFQRAARTDRSVSAVRQMCSMMLDFDEKLPAEGPNVLNALLPADIRVMGIRRATRTFHAQKSCDSRTYSYTLPTYAFAKVDQLTTNSYRIDDQGIEEINQILRLFVGTHNFYNYTARREADDRSCFRYIMEFKCDKVQLYKDEFTGQDTEFLTILIRGQSFMLHQIRKMIGMVIAVVRGFSYKSDIQRSFDAVRMDVPRAPGLGLLLEKLHYANYDRKFKNTHETLDDWGEEIESNSLRVRDELILSEIFKQEVRTQSMMLWLADLPKHDFISLPDSEAPNESLLHLAAKTAKVAECGDPDVTMQKESKLEEGESSGKLKETDLHFSTSNSNLQRMMESEASGSL